MNEEPDISGWMEPKEAAAALKLSPQTISRRCGAGILRACDRNKGGKNRKYRIDPASVKALLNTERKK